MYLCTYIFIYMCMYYDMCVCVRNVCIMLES